MTIKKALAASAPGKRLPTLAQEPGLEFPLVASRRLLYPFCFDRPWITLRIGPILTYKGNSHG